MSMPGGESYPDIPRVIEAVEDKKSFNSVVNRHSCIRPNAFHTPFENELVFYSPLI